MLLSGRCIRRVTHATTRQVLQDLVTISGEEWGQLVCAAMERSVSDAAS